MKRPFENDPENGPAFLYMFLSVIVDLQEYLKLKISRWKCQTETNLFKTPKIKIIQFLNLDDFSLYFLSEV